MKIVIDIDESILNDAKNGHVRLGEIADAVLSGTPIPEGHGDLIDRSKIYKAIPATDDNSTGMGMTLEERDAYNDGIDAMYSLVKGIHAIIEADKESENE